MLHFIINQAKVKLERSNEGVRNHLSGIVHFKFSDMVKYFVGMISKVKEQYLESKFRSLITIRSMITVMSSTDSYLIHFKYQTVSYYVANSL